jgi:hypothetical protein
MLKEMPDPSQGMRRTATAIERKRQGIDIRRCRSNHESLITDHFFCLFGFLLTLTLALAR